MSFKDFFEDHGDKELKFRGGGLLGIDHFTVEELYEAIEDRLQETFDINKRDEGKNEPTKEN